MRCKLYALVWTTGYLQLWFVYIVVYLVSFPFFHLLLLLSLLYGAGGLRRGGVSIQSTLVDEQTDPFSCYTC